MIDSAQLRRLALEHGAVGFGVCTAEPFVDVRRSIEERVELGLHGGMSFTFSDPARSTDVGLSFSWARRLVVVAWPYLPAAGAPGPAAVASGRVARFATDDHYRGLRDILGMLAAALEGGGHRAAVLADDNRLVDRGAAVRAGVGWWGKNTLVLRPGNGPWTLLGSVVTDAALPPDEPMLRDCGTCAACLPACPTGALVAPGVLDATRCLAYLLQAPGDIPIDLRVAAGDRVYGCDDCLDACPPGARLAGESTHVQGRVDLVELLTASDADLLADYGHFYIPRRRPDYLRRNALVALGNTGGDEHVDLLTRYLSSPNPMLRAHAAWALGRIGTAAAAAALAARATVEEEPGVAAEIIAAGG